MEQVKLGMVRLLSGGFLEPIEDAYINISQVLEEGMWLASINNPDAYSGSYDKGEALSGIEDQIASMWNTYAMQDDEKLTNSARVVKYNMLNKFRFVEE